MCQRPLRRVTPILFRLTAREYEKINLKVNDFLQIYNLPSQGFFE